MKKFTLLATMALAAVSANAQYTSDATTEAISNANPKAYFDIVAMQDACIDKLAAAGHKVQAVGPNNELRNLWYWEGTVDNTAVPATPGIGWNDTELNFDGAVSVEITGAANWSGLGYAIDPAENPADGVDFTPAAKKQIKHLESMGFGEFPVRMAKTQYSFSDDQTLLGAPRGFRITVREVKVSAGAGFVVALTGNIMTMPGLPKHPAAENIDVDETGKITGLF